MKLTTKQYTYEDILHYVSEEEIAMLYLGISTKKQFNSLFRKDPNPSANLYYKNGRLRYNDFQVNMTLSDLVMTINNWSYKEYIDHLKRDFLSTILSLPKKQRVVKKAPKDKKTEIKIKAREFEEYDLDFWGRGGITLDWLKDKRRKIKPIQYFWINGFLNVAEKYSYSYDYYWNKGCMRRKIYQPYSTDRKWISNVNATIVQNWDAIPKYNGGKLIITSSYKDAGVIECNITYPHSRKPIYSLSPNNEGVLLPEIVVPKIRDRFDDVFVWFDQDAAGHKAAKKYQQMYGYKPIFIPEGWAKDTFEFRDKYGKKEFIKLSNYLMYENI